MIREKTDHWRENLSIQSPSILFRMGSQSDSNCAHDLETKPNQKKHTNTNKTPNKALKKLNLLEGKADLSGLDWLFSVFICNSK